MRIVQIGPSYCYRLLTWVSIRLLIKSIVGPILRSFPQSKDVAVGNLRFPTPLPFQIQMLSR